MQRYANILGVNIMGSVFYKIIVFGIKVLKVR